MRFRTCIAQRARERGMTAAEIARRLKLYPSNLSAMDAGRRGVSLGLLARIAELLSLSPTDLIAVEPLSSPRLFRSSNALRAIEKREKENPDGTQKGWVHHVLLAWQRHYRSSWTRT